MDMSQHTTQLYVELVRDEDGGGFTASVPDIPAYGEGDTESEAIEDLKEALRLYIEVRGLEQAVALIRPRAVVRELELDLADLSRG
jgi:predicted RNase H-like HicB family nuclease